MANSATSNAALRAKFAALGRPSWKPLTADGDAALNGSKYSGLPLLQVGEGWPECAACGAAQQLFLQLSIATLPEGAQALLGLNTGMLQMFYCTVCEAEGESWAPFAPSHLLRIIDDRIGAEAPALPEEFHTRGETYFPAKTITGWAPFEDFPNLEEDIDLPELSDEEFDAYYVSEPYLNADGDKLGGWPAWVQSEEYPQCPECDTRMHAIYQLDSNDGVPWMWGDVGIGHITQCAKHRHVLAFGWACS